MRRLPAVLLLVTVHAQAATPDFDVPTQGSRAAARRAVLQEFRQEWASPLVGIRVVDEADHPVPSAVVFAPIESERHRVNGVDGTWWTKLLYPPDGSELRLERDTELALRVGAPGYATTSITVPVDDRVNTATVTLRRMELPELSCLPEGAGTLPADGARLSEWAAEQLGLPGERTPQAAWCLLGARAVGEALAWEAAEAAYQADPTMEAARTTAHAVERAHDVAKEWVEWSGPNGQDTAAATRLCEAASYDLASC